MVSFLPWSICPGFWLVVAFGLWRSRGCQIYCNFHSVSLANSLPSMSMNFSCSLLDKFLWTLPRSCRCNNVLNLCNFTESWPPPSTKVANNILNMPKNCLNPHLPPILNNIETYPNSQPNPPYLQMIMATNQHLKTQNQIAFGTLALIFII